MQAIKRAISLFLAGITALTMMCAGRISAGAELSSKMYVDGQIDENGNHIVIVGGISEKDLSTAINNAKKCKGEWMISAYLNGDGNMWVMSASSSDYTSFKNGDNISMSAAVGTANLEVSLSGTAYLIRANSEWALVYTFESDIYEKLLKCDSGYTSVGLYNPKTVELTDPDGSQITYQEIKPTWVEGESSPSSTSDTKKSEYTLTGKKKSASYELAIEGAYIDLAAEALYNIDISVPGKKSNTSISILFSAEDVGKALKSGDCTCICQYKGNYGVDFVQQVTYISYDKKKKRIAFDLNTKNKDVAAVLKELQKNDKVNYKFLYTGIDKDIPYQDLTISADWSGGKSVSAPNKVSTFTVKKTDEKYTFSWGKVSDADKYQIYYSTDGKKYTKLANVSGKKTSYSTAKLDESKTYSFKIRSYKKVDGKTYYSKFSKVVKK